MNKFSVVRLLVNGYRDYYFTKKGVVSSLEKADRFEPQAAVTLCAAINTLFPDADKKKPVATVELAEEYVTVRLVGKTIDD